MKIIVKSQSTKYCIYNILDCFGVYQACVPFNIRKGDKFNVMCFYNVKFKCVWLGDLEGSLTAFTEEDFYVAWYLEKAVKEVRDYSDGIINFREVAFPHNHLLCLYCDFVDMNSVQNIVDVFVKHPTARKLAIQQQNQLIDENI